MPAYLCNFSVPYKIIKKLTTEWAGHVMMVIILMNEVASSLPFLFGLCKRRRTEKSV
jgi:hypothetical protein